MSKDFFRGTKPRMQKHETAIIREEDIDSLESNLHNCGVKLEYVLCECFPGNINIVCDVCYKYCHKDHPKISEITNDLAMLKFLKCSCGDLVHQSIGVMKEPTFIIEQEMKAFKGKPSDEAKNNLIKEYVEKNIKEYDSNYINSDSQSKVNEIYFQSYPCAPKKIDSAFETKNQNYSEKNNNLESLISFAKEVTFYISDKNINKDGVINCTSFKHLDSMKRLSEFLSDYLGLMVDTSKNLIEKYNLSTGEEVTPWRIDYFIRGSPITERGSGTGFTGSGSKHTKELEDGLLEIILNLISEDDSFHAYDSEILNEKVYEFAKCAIDSLDKNYFKISDKLKIELNNRIKIDESKLPSYISKKGKSKLGNDSSNIINEVEFEETEAEENFLENENEEEGLPDYVTRQAKLKKLLVNYKSYLRLIKVFEMFFKVVILKHTSKINDFDFQDFLNLDIFLKRIYYYNGLEFFSKGKDLSQIELSKSLKDVYFNMVIEVMHLMLNESKEDLMTQSYLNIAFHKFSLIMLYGVKYNLASTESINKYFELLDEYYSYRSDSIDSRTNLHVLLSMAYYLFRIIDERIINQVKGKVVETHKDGRPKSDEDKFKEKSKENLFIYPFEMDPKTVSLVFILGKIFETNVTKCEKLSNLIAKSEKKNKTTTKFEALRKMSSLFRQNSLASDKCCDAESEEEIEEEKMIMKIGDIIIDVLSGDFKLNFYSLENLVETNDCNLYLAHKANEIHNYMPISLQFGGVKSQKKNNIEEFIDIVDSMQMNKITQDEFSNNISKWIKTFNNSINDLFDIKICSHDTEDKNNKLLSIRHTNDYLNVDINVKDNKSLSIIQNQLIFSKFISALNAFLKIYLSYDFKFLQEKQQVQPMNSELKSAVVKRASKSIKSAFGKSSTLIVNYSQVKREKSKSIKNLEEPEQGDNEEEKIDSKSPPEMIQEEDIEIFNFETKEIFDSKMNNFLNILLGLSYCNPQIVALFLGINTENFQKIFIKSNLAYIRFLKNFTLNFSFSIYSYNRNSYTYNEISFLSSQLLETFSLVHFLYNDKEVPKIINKSNKVSNSNDIEDEQNDKSEFFKAKALTNEPVKNTNADVFATRNLDKKRTIVQIPDLKHSYKTSQTMENIVLSTDNLTVDNIIEKMNDCFGKDYKKKYSLNMLSNLLQLCSDLMKYNGKSLNNLNSILTHINELLSEIGQYKKFKRALEAYLLFPKALEKDRCVAKFLWAYFHFMNKLRENDMKFLGALSKKHLLIRKIVLLDMNLNKTLSLDSDYVERDSVYKYDPELYFSMQEYIFGYFLFFDIDLNSSKYSMKQIFKTKLPNKDLNEILRSKELKNSWNVMGLLSNGNDFFSDKSQTKFDNNNTSNPEKFKSVMSTNMSKWSYERVYKEAKPDPMNDDYSNEKDIRLRISAVDNKDLIFYKKYVFDILLLRLKEVSKLVLEEIKGYTYRDFLIKAPAMFTKLILLPYFNAIQLMLVKLNYFTKEKFKSHERHLISKELIFGLLSHCQIYYMEESRLKSASYQFQESGNKNNSNKDIEVQDAINLNSKYYLIKKSLLDNGMRDFSRLSELITNHNIIIESSGITVKTKLKTQQKFNILNNGLKAVLKKNMKDTEDREKENGMYSSDEPNSSDEEDNSGFKNEVIVPEKNDLDSDISVVSADENESNPVIKGEEIFKLFSMTFVKAKNSSPLVQGFKQENFEKILNNFKEALFIVLRTNINSYQSKIPAIYDPQRPNDSPAEVQTAVSRHLKRVFIIKDVQVNLEKEIELVMNNWCKSEDFNIKDGNIYNTTLHYLLMSNRSLSKKMFIYLFKEMLRNPFDDLNKDNDNFSSFANDPKIKDLHASILQRISTLNKIISLNKQLTLNIIEEIFIDDGIVEMRNLLSGLVKAIIQYFYLSLDTFQFIYKLSLEKVINTRNSNEIEFNDKIQELNKANIFTISNFENNNVNVIKDFLQIMFHSPKIMKICLEINFTNIVKKPEEIKISANKKLSHVLQNTSFQEIKDKQTTGINLDSKNYERKPTYRILDEYDAKDQNKSEIRKLIDKIFQDKVMLSTLNSWCNGKISSEDFKKNVEHSSDGSHLHLKKQQLVDFNFSFFNFVYLNIDFTLIFSSRKLFDFAVDKTYFNRKKTKKNAEDIAEDFQEYNYMLDNLYNITQLKNDSNNSHYITSFSSTEKNEYQMYHIRNNFVLLLSLCLEHSDKAFQPFNKSLIYFMYKSVKLLNFMLKQSLFSDEQIASLVNQKVFNLPEKIKLLIRIVVERYKTDNARYDDPKFWKDVVMESFSKTTEKQEYLKKFINLYFNFSRMNSEGTSCKFTCNINLNYNFFYEFFFHQRKILLKNSNL